MLCTALLAIPGLTFGQQATTTGAVRGTVTSTSGEPITDVTVSATNVASGVRRSTRSDVTGRYQIPFLDPGFTPTRGASCLAAAASYQT